jgi:excisionase family DNA binding protein
MQVPKLVSVCQAAEILGVSRSTLYELIAAGAFPHIKIGRTIRVPRDAIDDWVAGELARGQAD